MRIHTLDNLVLGGQRTKLNQIFFTIVEKDLELVEVLSQEENISGKQDAFSTSIMDQILLETYSLQFP